jgi:hypothetical protein
VVLVGGVQTDQVVHAPSFGGGFGDQVRAVQVGQQGRGLGFGQVGQAGGAGGGDVRAAVDREQPKQPGLRAVQMLVGQVKRGAYSGLLPRQAVQAGLVVVELPGQHLGL